MQEPLAGSSAQGCGRHEANVLYRSEYNPFFKTNEKLFPAIEFLVQLLPPLPANGVREDVHEQCLGTSESRSAPWATAVSRETAGV
ncbi:MAG: hypothetical protein NT005_15150 [Spirochaetes bacterium]|nr:hypothetical protein [Spirochaetota bacterium]